MVTECLHTYPTRKYKKYLFATKSYLNCTYLFSAAVTDFAIDGNTGVITSTTVMNRTETSSYSLTVYASDPTSHISQLDITIDVNRALFLHGGFVSMLVLLALFTMH